MLRCGIDPVEKKRNLSDLEKMDRDLERKRRWGRRGAGRKGGGGGGGSFVFYFTMPCKFKSLLFPPSERGYTVSSYL